MSAFKTGDVLTNSNQITELPANTEFQDKGSRTIYYVSSDQTYVTAYLPEGARYPIPFSEIPSDMRYLVPIVITHMP